MLIRWLVTEAARCGGFPAFPLLCSFRLIIPPTPSEPAPVFSHPSHADSKRVLHSLRVKKSPPSTFLPRDFLPSIVPTKFSQKSARDTTFPCELRDGHAAPMELGVLWTLTAVLLLNALQVRGALPVPVVHFEENIIEDEDTTITCTFPSPDFPDVELVLVGNTTLRACKKGKIGDFPSMACTLEVTREMHEMDFTCEAKFKTQSLPKKMKLTMEPKFTDCPDRLEWLEGQKISFHCKATGYPQPNVTCERNKTIHREGETFTATRNMSGAYTCRARNFDVVTKRVNVSVECKPHILGVELSGPLHNRGDKVEMTCYADGSPDPSYRWEAPSSDVRLSPDNRTLTIGSLQDSHLGPYKCIVQNKHGADTAGKTLELAVKPSISMKPSTEVLEGDNVTLTCEASGFPRPVLSWATPGGVEISEDKSTVRIWGVKKGHVGSYTCTAQNKYGNDTQIQQLSLGVKPNVVQIKVQPSTSVAEGANVTLTCVAEGVPAPTYTWVPATSEVQYSSDKSAVHIRGAKKSHEGSYECKAQNKHGSSTRKETISVKVKESKGNRAERRGPSTAAILATLISTSLLYYLY